MAQVGQADLLIIPKFNGLSAQVNAELAKVKTDSSGEKAGSGFAGGIKKGIGGLVGSGAVIGAFSAITTKAMDVIGAHVGDAVSRLDTLKNYPKVMESLGVSSTEAQASIDTMSDRLSTLPTRLDTMASTVQGLYAATKDMGVSLGDATNAGLALNDMLLAGGQGTQVAGAAMEQFRQMLSKGKPDMQDWKSIITAAPGQMDQLAKSMLGPTANANDLYEALGGGGGKATISMDQLLDAIVKVDQQGGAGLASFKDQAEDATGGVQTSMDNLSNAFTKGIANVMDAIGRENIVAPINLAKDAVNGFFGVFATGAGNMSDSIKYFDNGASAIERINDAIQTASSSPQELAGSFDTLGETVEHAMERARASQEKATEAHHAYLDQLAQSAEVIEQATTAYQSQVSQLEYAGQVIDTYAGKTDLSTAQQQELKNAVETVNEVCGTQYQVLEDGSGKIADNTGKVLDNTDAIWDNIRAKEAAAKADLLQTDKLEADKAYAKAANEYQYQKQAATDSQAAVQALIDKYGSLEAVRKKATEITDPALSSSNLMNRSKESAEVLNALSAFNQYTQSLRDADMAQRQMAQSSRELAAESAALEAKAAGADLTIAQLALTTDVATEAFNSGGSKAKYSIEDFGNALEAASKNDEALEKAMGDPETMAKIVAAYDGTAGSLKDVLNDLGIEFDNDAAKALDAGSTIQQMGDWITGLSNDAYAAMALMGLSTDDLAGKLSDAGISTQQLNEIGSEAFSDMLANCGGDINTLIGMVALYNQAPIYDKDGNITIEQTQLTDAQGNVYTWNGTKLRDKDGNIVVEKRSLLDAYGNVVEYNGKKLLNKSASAKVTGNASDDKARDAINRVKDAISKLKSKTVEAKVTGNATSSRTARTISTVAGSIAGLFSKTVTATVNKVTKHITKYQTENANGGIVTRRHAAGAVFTSPTYISPNDIIGEAGDEWYDGTNIVPLSSSRARPLARVIAQEIAQTGHSGKPQVVQNITQNVYKRNDMFSASDILSRSLVSAISELM